MNTKGKKSFSALKLSTAVATLAVGLGAGSISAQAAFDAPYYNININGGTFDGNQYVLKDGSTVINSFFCDGTYTYFLQTDGTPMKDRLTYHPDGEQVIYFDSQGHECFDTFANVKKSIEGKDVDDLCYFGTTGNLYVNVITYNVEGTAIYYANPYGVMERNGVFELDTNAANYEALAKGCRYGYANSDGTVKGFYATYEEAAGLVAPGDTEELEGHWEYFGEIAYDSAGNRIYRSCREGNVTYGYSTLDGQEYLESKEICYYDAEGRYCGTANETYSLKEDGTTYLSCKSEKTGYPGQDETDWEECYDETGAVTGFNKSYYNGSLIQKREYSFTLNDGNYSYSSVGEYSYNSDGKLAHIETNATEKWPALVHSFKLVQEFDDDGNLRKYLYYSVDKEGKAELSHYDEYIYTIVNGKQVVDRIDKYYLESGTKKDPQYQLLHYEVYKYDEYGNCISEEDFYYDNWANNGNEQWQYNNGHEYEYIYRKGEWSIRKCLSYTGSMGNKIPSRGYEYFYDENDRLQKYVNYTVDNGAWKVSDYTVYHPIDLPKATEREQVTNVEYSRTYDGNDVCTGYTVYFYKFVE